MLDSPGSGFGQCNSSASLVTVTVTDYSFWQVYCHARWRVRLGNLPHAVVVFKYCCLHPCLCLRTALRAAKMFEEGSDQCARAMKPTCLAQLSLMLLISILRDRTPDRTSDRDRGRDRHVRIFTANRCCLAVVSRTNDLCGIT